MAAELPRLAATTVEARLAPRRRWSCSPARAGQASTRSSRSSSPLTARSPGRPPHPRGRPRRPRRAGAPRAELIVREAQREPGVLAAALRAAEEDAGAAPRAHRVGRDPLEPSLEDLVARVRLWPLTRSERLGLGVAGPLGRPARHARRRLVRPGAGGGRRGGGLGERTSRAGGFPGLLGREGWERDEWLSDRVARWLEHDLRALSAVDDLLGVHRLMRAACRRVGQVANQAELSRETGISAPTVYRYLKLLETSYQLVRLDPSPVAGTRRTVRTPKLYWADTALTLHLGGGESHAGHLENMVLGDLLAWRDAQLADAGCTTGARTSGEEVDFVVEQGGRLLAAEVRASVPPHHRDAAPTCRPSGDSSRTRCAAAPPPHRRRHVLAGGGGAGGAVVAAAVGSLLAPCPALAWLVTSPVPLHEWERD